MLKEDLLRAIQTYYRTLEVFGYFSYREVAKLIVMLFFEEVLEGKFGLLEEEDYKLIIKAMNCIYGSNCLLPYPEYTRRYKKAIEDHMNTRITEDNITRVTEDSVLRRTE